MSKVEEMSYYASVFNLRELIGDCRGLVRELNTKTDLIQQIIKKLDNEID